MEKLLNLGLIFESVSLTQDELIEYVERKINTKIQHYDIVENTGVDIPTHFKNLHTHSDIEARYFLDGSGSFGIDVHGTVYKIDCVKNHLLIIPKNIAHYFIPSKDHYFKVLRLFTDKNGWQADFVSNNDTNS